MADKFRKVVAVIKASTITEISAETDDDCPKTYEQVMASKDKHKWLAAMQDELQLQGE